MIDLRKRIQQRLDQLAGEADRLRKALTILDPRSSPNPARGSTSRTPSARQRTRAAAPQSGTPKSAATRSPRRRTAPGATKAAVLAALTDGDAMTAGQVADKTGIARPTVSTTLSKLSKTGEVQKAERGYRLPSLATISPSLPEA